MSSAVVMSYAAEKAKCPTKYEKAAGGAGGLPRLGRSNPFDAEQLNILLGQADKQQLQPFERVFAFEDASA